MNPLTLVKRTQQINSREAALGITEEASWHAKYKDSAYVYAGGIPFDLTEGDLLAVFSQYGEIVDVNLVRDKGTGKSKGFAFIAYENQRSTNLAVDNLNGAQVLGRIIRVDHVSNYKKKEEEDEEAERQKREERGVCRAFQRGQCTRGDGCKFSHDEKRAANTGWGHEDARSSKWGHDKFEPKSREDGNERDKRRSRYHNDEAFEPRSRENHDRKEEKRLRRHDDDEFEPNGRESYNRRDEKGRSRQNDDEIEPILRKGHDRSDESRLRRHESDSYLREDREKGGEKRSTHNRDPPSHHYRERNQDQWRKSDR